MRKFYLLFAMSAAACAANAQTLITYGNSTVGKEEFWRAYNKNKPEVSDKEKAIRDYADLYINFKLKVKAAQDQRLDTLQQIQYDVQNFRNQVTENYLNDDKGMQRLLDEAFDRSQKDLHVLHFSVSVAADSAKASKAAQELYSLLQSGKINYADIAKELTEKYTPVNQSDLGFITAFTVPYEYENIIYGTKTGGVTAPYRSKNGWHIFKVVEEKPAAGKWKVGQILFTFPPDVTEDAKVALKRKADSVYNLVKNGAMSFAAAAKIFSDDKLTYLTEGELPEFTAGKYTYAFESQVFNLKKDGEISKPFETPFGYHIVKRISQVPVVTVRTDEGNLFDLKQKIMNDGRINVEREKFSKDIISKTGIKKLPAVTDKDLYRFADSLMKDPSIENTVAMPISKKNVAVFSDRSVLNGGDWLKFVRAYRSSTDQDQSQTNAQLWDKFIAYSAVEYYKTHLENYNQDFKFQMQEFKEGNMLFEIMERNVWNKAISDVSGLQKYYAAHKDKYKWGPSADVIVFNCSSEKVANDALAALKSGRDWKKVVEESSMNISADSGRYELNQIIGSEFTSQPAKGVFSQVVPANDGTAAFVEYLNVYPTDMQRNFEEARGLVINDYQNVLEEQWLASLKKKYPVKLNEAVLKTLIK